MVLIGPTASGKTEVAFELARFLPLEFVCLDSMQIYREMRVGTAAPGEKELQRVPHHGFGVASVREPLTGVTYARMAAIWMGEIQARGNIPLLIGGTGLYLRFLFQDVRDLPATPPELRARLDALIARRGLNHVYALLTRLDPRGASRLHPNDTQRIKRFLEVRLLTGRSVLDFWADQESSTPSEPVGLGLKVPRDLLWDRIQNRLDIMLPPWIEEAETLRDAGFTDMVTELGAIGYREMFSFLDQEVGLDDLKQRIYYSTRRYAKRQMTWFRKVPYIRWFPYRGDSGYNRVEMAEYARNRLGLLA